MLKKRTKMLELIREAREDVWRFWDRKSGGFKVSLIEPTVAPAPTAECAIALSEADQIVKDTKFRRNKKKIMNYLLSTKWTDAGGHYENVMAYSFALIALKKLGCSAKNKRIKQGLQFLIKNQERDGGWSFTKGQSSHPFFTFLALDALLNHNTSHYKNNIQDCYNYFNKLIHNGEVKHFPSSYARCLLGVRKAAEVLGLMNQKLKAEIEEGIKSIKLAQREDGTWEPEPSPVNLASFRMNIFTVETARFLLEMEDCAFDKTYGRFLNWIKNNKKEVGWCSDVEKSESGFSWTTAMVLLTMCRFYEKINDVNTIMGFFAQKWKPTSFIAYASEDEDKAFILKEYLEELGLKATGMFNINTQVGPVNNIMKQLASSDCLFAIYTENTEKRPNAWKNVLGEYLAAKITNKVAIILLEEGVTLPSNASYSCTYLQFKKGFLQAIFTQILKVLKDKRLLSL